MAPLGVGVGSRVGFGVESTGNILPLNFMVAPAFDEGVVPARIVLLIHIGNPSSSCSVPMVFLFKLLVLWKNIPEGATLLASILSAIVLIGLPSDIFEIWMLIPVPFK